MKTWWLFQIHLKLKRFYRVPLKPIESVNLFSLGGLTHDLSFLGYRTHFGQFSSACLDLRHEIIIAETESLNLLLYLLPLSAKHKTESLATFELFTHLVVRQNVLETLFGHAL